MIAKQVKRLRLKKDITPYRLSKLAKVTTATIYNLENNKPVSVTTLEKVSKALDAEIIITPIK